MPIVHLDDDGEPMVRENFVFALFFKRPPEAVATQARRLLDRWLALVPPDALTAFGARSLADTLRELAGLLPFDSGYAGPGLMWCYEGTLTEAGEVIAPFALRHPGYDVSNNDATASHLGTRSRGARWITLLGPGLVAELSGTDALRASLGEAIRIEPAGAGIAITAGPEPEIGDVNRKQDTPLLRQVAKALEPVTFFGDRFLDVLLADDEDKRGRWERRLLDERG